MSTVPLAAEEPPSVFAPGVTSGPAHDAAPAFSPDGKTLYFTSNHSQLVHRSRSRAEMLENVARMESWDNGNNNVWTLPLEPYLSAKLRDNP